MNPEQFEVRCADCGSGLSVNEHPIADQPCLQCGSLERLFIPWSVGDLVEENQ